MTDEEARALEQLAKPLPVWPKLMRDAIGMKVRTLREMRNGFMIIPAGTVATITSGYRWERLEIEGQPCTCCGVRVLVSCVSKGALEPAGE